LPEHAFQNARYMLALVRREYPGFREALHYERGAGKWWCCQSGTDRSHHVSPEIQGKIAKIP
jgi:hypothetical protein